MSAARDRRRDGVPVRRCSAADLDTTRSACAWLVEVALVSAELGNSDAAAAARWLDTMGAGVYQCQLDAGDLAGVLQ